MLNSADCSVSRPVATGSTVRRNEVSGTPAGHGRGRVVDKVQRGGEKRQQRGDDNHWEQPAAAPNRKWFRLLWCRIRSQRNVVLERISLHHVR